MRKEKREEEEWRPNWMDMEEFMSFRVPKYCTDFVSHGVLNPDVVSLAPLREELCRES